MGWEGGGGGGPHFLSSREEEFIKKCIRYVSGCFAGGGECLREVETGERDGCFA